MIRWRPRRASSSRRTPSSAGFKTPQNDIARCRWPSPRTWPTTASRRSAPSASPMPATRGWVQRVRRRLRPRARGLQIVANEALCAHRHGRHRPGATKIVAHKPDAVLVATASGTPAALPQKTLRARTLHRQALYQTHGSRQPTSLRVGGEDVDDAFLPAGAPCWWPSSLPPRIRCTVGPGRWRRPTGAAHVQGLGVDTFGARAWDAKRLAVTTAPTARRAEEIVKDPARRSSAFALRGASSKQSEGSAHGAHGIFTACRRPTAPGPGPACTVMDQDRQQRRLEVPATDDALKTSTRGDLVGAGSYGRPSLHASRAAGRARPAARSRSQVAEKIRISGGGRCTATRDATPASFLSRTRTSTARRWRALAARISRRWSSATASPGTKRKGQLFCDRSAGTSSNAAGDARPAACNGAAAQCARCADAGDDFELDTERRHAACAAAGSRHRRAPPSEIGASVSAFGWPHRFRPPRRSATRPGTGAADLRGRRLGALPCRWRASRWKSASSRRAGQGTRPFRRGPALRRPPGRPMIRGLELTGARASRCAWTRPAATRPLNCAAAKRAHATSSAPRPSGCRQARRDWPAARPGWAASRWPRCATPSCARLAQPAFGQITPTAARATSKTEVTLGGVDAAGSTADLESRLQPGLHFIGRGGRRHRLARRLQLPVEPGPARPPAPGPGRGEPGPLQRSVPTYNPLSSLWQTRAAIAASRTGTPDPPVSTSSNTERQLGANRSTWPTVRVKANEPDSTWHCAAPKRTIETRAADRPRPQSY